MIRNLILFGATGDLSGRFLFPALAKLLLAGKLPRDFAVFGTSTKELDQNDFQQQIAERLREYAPDVPQSIRDDLVRRLQYRAADLSDQDAVTRLLRIAAPADEASAVYLALPTQLFPDAVKILAGFGLPEGSRIIIEKPFGVDLESAISLNRLFSKAFGKNTEQIIYRVDHALGMATVQNLVGMRMGNPALEAIWNSGFIERVEIYWEETLGLEGRGSYFDRAGTLKDVVQNHMLQIFSLIAMELPYGSEKRELHDRKRDALRSVRSLSSDEITTRSQRARYTAGRLVGEGEGGSRTVSSYAEEQGVDPSRCTETFAEVLLDVESERWKGTTFRLRAGKALSGRRKEVVLGFRRASSLISGGDLRTHAVSELRVGIDGPNDLTLHLVGSATGDVIQPTQLTLTGGSPKSDLPAYGHVFQDILSRGSALSVHSHEAEEAWRIVTPVLSAWAQGGIPLLDYAAGSTGPAPLGESRRSFWKSG